MEDVLRMLMEAWGALLSRSWCSPGAHGGGDHDTQIPPEIVNGAAQVFQAYLQAGLRAAAEAGRGQSSMFRSIHLPPSIIHHPHLLVHSFARST